MVRPTSYGSSLLGPKTVAAFAVGVTIGLALVAPVLPEVGRTGFVALVAGAGSVILVGVGALAVLMVLLALFYHLYL